jgi:gamma-glutamylputrescine oxidase
MSFVETDRELTRHSYYAATAPQLPAFAPLPAGPHTCDVAVVGGGLAGLSAAIELHQRGFAVTLLEAQSIGHGASGRNGGQAIYGLACDITTIEDQLGRNAARQVFAMSLEAIDLIRERIARFAIDCDWRDGYLGVAMNARKARALCDEVALLAERYDHALTWVAQSDLPQWIDSPRYVAAAHDPRSGHLHPLKYTRGLAKAAAALGVSLHENTAITTLANEANGVRLTTNHGATVRARHVLLAGNVYLQALSPSLAPTLSARIMPVGTYIVCSQPVAPALAASLIPCGAGVCDNNFVLDYFRTTPDHRMLYGGRVSYSTRTPMDLAASMTQRMTTTFPQLRGTSGEKAEYAWGGFVDISMNRAPDFGRLQGFDNRVYYLQGFSGHGLALTGLAGKLVAEAIAGDASRFDVFAKLKHLPFPGGAALRTPALVLGMAYAQLRDLLR